MDHGGEPLRQSSGCVWHVIGEPLISYHAAECFDSHATWALVRRRKPSCHGQTCFGKLAFEPVDACTRPAVIFLWYLSFLQRIFATAMSCKFCVPMALSGVCCVACFAWLASSSLGVMLRVAANYVYIRVRMTFCRSPLPAAVCL